MHKAGFPRDRIQSDGVSWATATLEKRRLWANGAKNGFRAIGLQAGYGTEADYDEIARRWEAWAEHDAGRLVAIDGTVIAFK